MAVSSADAGVGTNGKRKTPLQSDSPEIKRTYEYLQQAYVPVGKSLSTLIDTRLSDNQTLLITGKLQASFDVCGLLLVQEIHSGGGNKISSALHMRSLRREGTED